MRIRVLRLVDLGLAAFLVNACLGCGSAENRPTIETIPVKGKVTYRGKPLTKGTIEFEPVNRGRSAFGELQSDGTYTLKTLNFEGVSPGLSRVAITGTGSSLSRELIPKKYTQVQSSKLEAVVSTEKTEFDFDLK